MVNVLEGMGKVELIGVSNLCRNFSDGQSGFLQQMCRTAHTVVQ